MPSGIWCVACSLTRAGCDLNVLQKQSLLARSAGELARDSRCYFSSMHPERSLNFRKTSDGITTIPYHEGFVFEYNSIIELIVNRVQGNHLRQDVGQYTLALRCRNHLEVKP